MQQIKLLTADVDLWTPCKYQAHPAENLDTSEEWLLGSNPAKDHCAFQRLSRYLPGLMSSWPLVN